MTPAKTMPKRISPETNSERIPPLQNGDRLSVEEFERRYTAMPHVNKADLINGVVYMPSPVLNKAHATPHFDVIAWLGLYRIATPGVEGGDNATLRLQQRSSRPQPDVYLRILPSYGGQSGDTPDGYVAGAPELLFEVAATSTNYDLNEKLETYRENGVREYVVWRVWDNAIDWFILRGDRYDRVATDATGVYRSDAFPGLWLDLNALVTRDMVRVANVLQQGLASPEHAAFVAQLQARAPRS